MPQPPHKLNFLSDCRGFLINRTETATATTTLPNTVTLRQLRAFAAVAERGSFTAASRALSLTPSALSLLVKQLEEGVGVRLFERSTRRTQLSLAGSEFLPLATKVLDDLSRAVESTRELQQKKRGTVRIACTPLYSAMLMPTLIARYREQYPAIHVYVLDSLNQAALERVASGEADFGIAPQRATPPDLVQRSLFKDRFMFVCGARHPLAQRKAVNWAQLLREPFVTLTPDFTASLQADLFRHSSTLVLQPAHRVSLVTTAFGMVRAGLGITAQPGSAGPLAETFGLVSRPLAGPVVHRHLSLYEKRGRPHSPAAASFQTFLLAQFDAHPMHEPRHGTLTPSSRTG